MFTNQKLRNINTFIFASLKSSVCFGKFIDIFPKSHLSTLIDIDCLQRSLQEVHFFNSICFCNYTNFSSKYVQH